MTDNEVRDVPLIDRVSFNSVSWGAIWAGAMLTIGMEFLFLSFGAFVGGALGGSTAWTMAWYLITMAISFFTGAWGAAKLAGVPNRAISVLHGLATWGLATLSTAVIGGAAAWVLMTRMNTILSSSILWSRAEEWGGVIWGGILLSCIAAYLGSGSATAATDVEHHGTTSVPVHRIS